MSEEIWKDVVGYNGFYKVSSKGNVKSFKKWRGSSERLLTPSLTNRGYPFVVIYKGKTAKSTNIHKLMQLAFDLGDGSVDHIDGEKTNNDISNLRVVTDRANSQNLKCHRNGKLVGACFEHRLAHREKSWKSHIRINGILKHLGHFKTEVEAHERYMEELNKQG